MRVWIKFGKEEELKFLSHLDLVRAWQRALRRAALPVAYSEGFNPHMRLSFASALPVGVTSGAEYADITFLSRVDEEGLAVLRRQMPRGLEIQAFREVPAPVPSLMALAGAAAWSVPLSSKAVADSIQRLLSSAALTVEREGKKGKKTVDLRPLIIRLDLVSGHGGTYLHMLLAAGESGTARPQEILGLLGLPPVDLRRTEFFLKTGDTLQAPLDVVFTESGVQADAKKNYYKL